MRYAVKDRPVEKFETDLKLPEWQLEPDEEVNYGDPNDYYYIDEQGNLVEPGKPQQPGQPPFPVQGEDGVPPGQRRTPGSVEPGQAASDDFLDKATGKGQPAPAAPLPRQPALQPPRPRATSSPVVQPVPTASGAPRQ
jgi:penicillin-binding protein 1A